MKTYNEMFLELTGPNGFFEGQEENLKSALLLQPEHMQSLYAQFSLAALKETARLVKPHWDAVAKAQETA